MKIRSRGIDSQDRDPCGQEAVERAAQAVSIQLCSIEVRNLLARDQAHTSSGGVYSQYEKLESLGHMGHVREYTVTEVSDFLGRIGFLVDGVIFRGGHGVGMVGLVERIVPALRPFFSLVARKEGAGAAGSEDR